MGAGCVQWSVATLVSVRKGNANLWKLLREDGILVEPLYREVLKNQELKPQAIIDLIEHFLIIAPIHTSNKHKCAGKEYFVPCMLPLTSSRVAASSNALQSAAPLHLIFSTNYRPPGFFPRLATVLSKHPKFKVDFSGNLCRNQLTFYFGPHGQLFDTVTATEEKCGVRIQVQQIHSYSFRFSYFHSTCRELLQVLLESCKVVKEWLPGIDVSMAFECNTCPEKDHFVELPSPPTYLSSNVLSCQKHQPSELKPEQMYWLDIHQVRVYLVWSLLV